MRWSPCGNMIATASDDMTIKLADLATAHVLYKTNTADGRKTIPYDLIIIIFS